MKLIIISEHPCCRLGIATTLKEVGPAVTIFELTSIDQMLELQAEQGRIDLVLLDTSSQFGREMAAITALQEIEGIGAVVVLHEQDNPEMVRRYLDMGVQGVVPKTSELEVLLSAVRLVLSGARYVPDSILSPGVSGFEETEGRFGGAGLEKLTRRQMDVLKELGRGASNQEIGTQLGIALATVKLHVNAILNTLGVRNRTEAAIIAYRAGLTDIDRGQQHG